MTISSPRSIGSILEQLSRLRNSESEVVFINLEIDRPAIIDFHSERRASLSNANVVLRERDAEFFALRNNVAAQNVDSLPRRRGELYILADRVVELERGIVGRNILYGRKYN